MASTNVPAQHTYKKVGGGLLGASTDGRTHTLSVSSTTPSNWRRLTSCGTIWPKSHARGTRASSFNACQPGCRGCTTSGFGLPDIASR